MQNNTTESRFIMVALDKLYPFSIEIKVSDYCDFKCFYCGHSNGTTQIF